ncbi:cryptochrome/photolyase family protein [Pseudomonadales bacterium]|nr:cryptochrome/photolyase family protein [Pseudomonadales bacterium]
MTSTLLILPDQLFKHHAGLQNNQTSVVMVEAPFYFDSENPSSYHRQKLILHRASMQAYKAYLEQQGFSVRYYDACTNVLEAVFADLSVDELVMMDPVNVKLKALIESVAVENKVTLSCLSSQNFINTREYNEHYRSTKKRWFMADFYQQQRKRLDILMAEGKPVGGKWSFDADNRKKIPKAKRHLIPELQFPATNQWVEEAEDYVSKHFADAIGEVAPLYYPVTFDAAEQWLQAFLEQRFSNFGDYEDALVPNQNWLYHSILTPMMNIGLLTPQQVVDAALQYADQAHLKNTEDAISIASLEGFIRQIIGWREFMRATYDDLGATMRSGNHWQHHHVLPESFYDGTTGLAPIDDVIKRVLKTGYCHHIERLMVLGGFMFLCEFDPDDIYRWFMTMFVDAYDWVMVPNVYAMSQHADGGLITTKPYFSGSAYLKKMGYDETGEWCDIWDALYWRWIWKQKDALGKNPRWAMMCRLAEKMDDTKMNQHLVTANDYLASFSPRR